ncbi:MAG TPA: AMP-binding protein, partial [Thermoanaerobaculia bacterium]|nr:AMP-binding protein [Thermoanaerobaculia bacterium]
MLDAALHAERSYWAGRLAAGVETVAPAADGRRSAAGAPVLRRHELPGELSRRLERISGGSPWLQYAAIAAGLACLLTHWSGPRRVVLGSPALGSSPGVPPNAVALCLEPRPGLSFRRFLAETRDALREAYGRQRYPWSRLVRELGFPGVGAGGPDFGVIAGLDGLHGPLPDGLTADLVLAFRRRRGRLEVEAASPEGVYLRSTVQRFLTRWSAGLLAALRDVDMPLARLGWSSAAERHQVRLEWPAGPEAAVPVECLHHLVSAQATAAPDAPAVIDAAGRMSYRRLDRRANALARRLVAEGVGPESRVGVLLERSRDLAVALLGVLKAGAAFVPLDPSLPRERLRYLVEDSRALRVISEVGPEEAAEAPAVEASPGNLAYVIYTSGSTGTPKGVMVPHRGLVSYLRWCAAAYDVAAGEGAPVFTSIGFDLTVTGLWAPLVTGRPVWLVAGDSPVETLLGARRRGSPLSLVKLTPAHLELLAATRPDASLAACARSWIVGGEALRGAHLAPWLAPAPEAARWINEYGPTETVVGCCVHRAGPEDLGA